MVFSRWDNGIPLLGKRGGIRVSPGCWPMSPEGLCVLSPRCGDSQLRSHPYCGAFWAKKTPFCSPEKRWRSAPGVKGRTPPLSPPFLRGLSAKGWHEDSKAVVARGVQAALPSLPL